MRTNNAAKKRSASAKTSTGAFRTAAIALLTTFMLLAFTAQAFALVDLASPSDGSHTNQTNKTFEYYINFNATRCDLLIDGEVKATDNNLTEGFQEIASTLSEGEHAWKVACGNGNLTEESTEYVVTADFHEPTIVLFTPAENALITEEITEISFVSLDTYSETIQCEIIIDDAPSYAINATNSEAATIGINIEDGSHSWSVKCTDNAGNQETSETRGFQVNRTIIPVFGLTLSRNEFYTGEQGTLSVAAPHGSSARVEVCPDVNGFVECSVPVDVQNSDAFPIQTNLPFLYQAGKYVVEAHFTYQNTTETKVERYNVTSNIAISVSAPSNPRKNEPIILKANAGGGYGKLNFTWHLSDGRNINDDEANITYNSAGNFTNIIEVTDAYYNSVNQTVNLSVSDSYKIWVIVKDSDTNAAISHATVEIDGQEKETGTTGQVEMNIRGGKRDLVILAENYSIYTAELNITKDETFTIMLQRLISGRTNPKVTLLSPDNEAKIAGSQTIIGFKVEHAYKTNCSIYISEETNSDFYIFLGNIEVPANDASNKELEVIDLENMSYNWKVECVDDKNYKGLSETRTIHVGATSLSSQSSPELEIINNRVKEYEQLLSDFGLLPKKLKEGVDMMGITSQLEDAIRVMKNAIRDIDGLAFKNLNPADKASERSRLLKEAEEAYQKAPVNAELLGSDNFIDYIESADLEELAREMASLTYTPEEVQEINIGRALKTLEDLQQEVVISTKIKNIRIYYRDGTQKDMTLVMRDVKTYNITSDTILVERIPKEFAQSASMIKSNVEFQTVKDDPIISFQLSKDVQIGYYVEQNIDESIMKNIRNAVFRDVRNLEPEYVTGFSIKDLNLSLPSLGNAWALIIIIVVLTGVIVAGTKFGGLEAARYTAYLLGRKNTLHYVNVILNDLEDNLQTGDLAKAVSLYNEAKDAYAGLPSMAKNDVYDSIVSSAEKIRRFQNSLNGVSSEERPGDSLNPVKELSALVSSTGNNMGFVSIHETIENYKQIECMYNRLSDNDKEVLHGQIVNLGNRIKLQIESNKDLI
ncbi:PKD domain-containing protein [Candidatus Woesearchaeota archaeon]|nr:PKD domain-containing protein [Candidatus Woesearchaeota archaeon]